MTDDLSRTRELLRSEGVTLALCRDDRTYISKDRGIKPLLQLIGTEEDWRGASAADRIVGKAAAMLYVLLGVEAVFAEVLGEEAKRIFEQYHIAYAYDTLTAHIINREGSGLCPMELEVQDVDSPAAALAALRQKVSEMQRGR